MKKYMFYWDDSKNCFKVFILQRYSRVAERSATNVHSESLEYQIDEIDKRIEAAKLDRDYPRLRALILMQRNLYDQLNEYGLKDGGLRFDRSLGGRKI